MWRESSGTVGWLRVLFHLTLLLILASSCLAVVATVRGIGASGETMYSEGAMLYNFLQVRDGRPLYVDYQHAPFNVAAYFPLYYYLVGLGARLAQLDPGQTLILARSVAAIGTLAAVATTVTIARHCGASPWAAMASGGLIISSYVVHPWGYTARPDTLALAFSMAGLWVGVRRPGLVSALAAGGLLAGAFYTKQSYVVAGAVLGLAAVGDRQWARAGVLVASWGVCVVGGATWLQSTTGGLFAANVVGTQALPMQIETVLQQA